MIQIDIKMPKSCWNCPMANTDQGYCQITYEDVPIELNGRLDDCPLKEVNGRNGLKRRKKNDKFG